MNIAVSPALVPELDPGFVPAVLWNRAYRKAAKDSGAARDVVIALYRPNGTVSTFATPVLPDTADTRALNVRYVERLVKFLLWMKGGYKVGICGAPEIAQALASVYGPAGARKFDFEMMGERIYGRPFEVVALDTPPESREIQVRLGGHMDGCRIGFDLGGSDRKCAAVVDGKVVHTEEVK